MKIFKKFAFCLLAAVISSSTYAEIIELDAFNPDHCRQQILQSADDLPIIASYSSDKYDSTSKEFMEKFTLLAKNHPERTFFKWDTEKDKLHETQSLCMQQLGLFVQPNIILLNVSKDHGQMIMTSPLRLEWAGEMTIADMNKFIDLSDGKIKQSILFQKNRH